VCGSHCKNDDVTLQNFLLINIDLENGQRNKKKKINFIKKKKENGEFTGRCAWLLLHWKFGTLQLSMYGFERIGGCNFM
jgi:hypothetical protein